MKRFKGLFAFLAVCVLTLFPLLSNAAITYSVTTKHRGNMGDQAIVIAQIDLAGTYATNGFTLTPKDFGLSTINQVIIPDYAGYSFAWDRANAKVKVYSGGADSTPSGAITVTTHGDSAGTPEGTVSTVGITITVDTGSIVDTVGFDASGNFIAASTGGTINAVMSTAPVFTGTIMSEHSHANTAVFTGIASATGAAEEVDNGTSLAAVNTIEIVLMGR